jgi:lipid-binding SYLF domain-containing protein
MNRGERDVPRRKLYFLFSVFAALLLPAAGVHADSKAAIDAKSQEVLARLRAHAVGAAELLDDAAGVLVFPDLVKMGFGVGGEFGEGSLLVDGKPQAYYATAGSSFGLPPGSQFKSEMILFMTEEALQQFRARPGFHVGVDGQVSLVRFGEGGRIDRKSLVEPLLGFIFSDRGLLHGLTLEGDHIRRIAR